MLLKNGGEMRNFLVGSRKRGLWLLVGASVGAALAGGVAYASIPDSGGVIHGCYLNAIGTLRVIDSPNQSCNARLETQIQWNAQSRQA